MVAVWHKALARREWHRSDTSSIDAAMPGDTRALAIQVLGGGASVASLQHRDVADQALC